MVFQFADVFYVLPCSKEDVVLAATAPWPNGRVEAEFMATITSFLTGRIPNLPERFVSIPGVCNQQEPCALGGPRDWMVVPEGTTSIAILGELLPQD